MTETESNYVQRDRAPREFRVCGFQMNPQTNSAADAKRSSNKLYDGDDKEQKPQDFGDNIAAKQIRFRCLTLITGPGK